MSESEGTHNIQQEFRVPIPDPTTLTTQQLHREIDQSEAKTNARIDGVESVMTERMRQVESRFLDRYMFSWALVLAIILSAGLVATILLVFAP